MKWKLIYTGKRYLNSTIETVMRIYILHHHCLSAYVYMYTEKLAPNNLKTQSDLSACENAIFYFQIVRQ